MKIVGYCTNHLNGVNIRICVYIGVPILYIINCFRGVIASCFLHATSGPHCSQSCFEKGNWWQWVIDSHVKTLSLKIFLIYSIFSLKKIDLNYFLNAFEKYSITRIVFYCILKAFFVFFKIFFFDNFQFDLALSKTEWF